MASASTFSLHTTAFLYATRAQLPRRGHAVHLLRLVLLSLACVRANPLATDDSRPLEPVPATEPAASHVSQGSRIRGPRDIESFHPARWDTTRRGGTSDPAPEDLQQLMQAMLGRTSAPPESGALAGAAGGRPRGPDPAGRPGRTGEGHSVDVPPGAVAPRGGEDAWAPEAGTLLWRLLTEPSLDFRDRIAELHNPKAPLNKIRKEWDESWKVSHRLFTWEENSEVVQAAGHEWCGLVRDNWACVGEHYGEVLKASAPFNTSSSLQHFPPGTRIFAEGNSFLAQLVFGLVCNSDVEVWRSRLPDPVTSTQTNSLLVHARGANVTLLLLDNNVYWNSNLTRTIELLHKLNFEPHFVILGGLNEQFEAAELQRLVAYGRQFPQSTVVPMFGSHLPDDCASQRHDCGKGSGHQCFPGPMLRQVEALAEHLRQWPPSHGATAPGAGGVTCPFCVPKAIILNF